MRYCIGTASAIKLGAAKKVIETILGDTPFEIEGMETDSGVPLTPWNRETLMGARNRAAACREMKPEADYWVGLESGIVERFDATFEEAWACVLTRAGEEYLGFSSGLKVPDYVLSQMKERNEEHRQVMHRLRKNPDGPKDTWGDYSAGMILRTVSLEESLRNALIQVFAPQESYYRRK